MTTTRPVERKNNTAHPLLRVRRADDRGTASLGWLDSRHSFSFGDYYDPQHMGVGHLRVVNEDRIVAGAGFPQHSHRDMEILSYVLEGSLLHRDNMGNSGAIRPGDVQLMCAGTGVTHSEFNESQEAPVHFLQIWIEPAQKSLTPSYEQRSFTDSEKRKKWRLLASPNGHDSSLTVHQDLRLYATRLVSGEQITQAFDRERQLWLQVINGTVSANGISLSAGDGLAAKAVDSLELCASTDSHVLLFDLA